MELHIVQFIGPINHSSASAVRNLCLQAVQNGATGIELHMSSEGGNMTAGFALYFFLKSLPVPLATHNIGSIKLHWGFGSLVAADHSRVSEWRDCLDFDAEHYASIFLEATTAAGIPTDIHTNLFGNARIFDADDTVRAGIVHQARQAQLPPRGGGFALMELTSWYK